MIRVPTPLQQLNHPILEEKQLTVSVKRDDLTHPEIMGNKWRKLKYNLEAARQNGIRKIVTMGGGYSNHIAATAAAAAEFGFDSLGIIRGDELYKTSNETLALASRKGMQLRFIDRSEYRSLREKPEQLQAMFPDAYILPEGGTNELAIRGCTEILSEIDIDFDLIVCPVGTGGTYCGLVNSVSKDQSVLGFSALKGDFIHMEVAKLQKKYGIEGRGCRIITDYHFGGYGKTTSELIEFIDWFKEIFQIQLDPIYTGKCFFGVWDMVKRNKFDKNLRIVLLHTGGLQGIGGINRKNQVVIQ